MAIGILLQEGFEGSESGYDNSGWSEVINATGSIDPDYTTPAGGPTGSLTDVLRSTAAASGDKGYSEWNYGIANDRNLIRFYFNVVSESLSDGQTAWIFIVTNSGGSLSNYIRIYQDGANLKVQHILYTGGTTVQVVSETISTDTWYRYEFRYDIVSLLYEVRLNGVNVGSGSLTVATRDSQILRVGIYYCQNAIELLIDLIEWNDSHWPGKAYKNRIGRKRNIVNRPYIPVKRGEIVGN